ncbi:unnamed protein product [Somion occarium]
MLLVLSIARWTAKPQTAQLPITEDNLQQTISDLTLIHALLPSLSSFRSSQSTPNLSVLLRVLGILYVPYLLLTYIIRLRILIAIAGTILLTWRARWATAIRRGFWRSAWMRWTLYRAWSLLSGQPLPPPVISPQTAKITRLSATTSAQTVNSIRFLFTVYENQRWWVGLDWTAALLPGERPSWCSGSQQPVAPPSVFSLPASTTVYMREGNKRIRRTARWKWEEDEWRVIVHKEGTTLARVERPIPTEDPTAPTGATRLMRVAGKMRQASLSGSGSEAPGSSEKEEGEGGGKTTEKSPSSKDDGSDDEVYTDADGWVYGDNKWENESSRGGMGKYTRYRRWTRIAVLSETVETVEDGEVGIRRDDGSPIKLNTHTKSPSQTENVASGALSPDISSPTDERSKLRQRLQAAVVKGTAHA